MARDQFAWVPNEWGPRVKTSKFTPNTPTDTYVCTACGYFEHYLADAGKLSEVAQSWSPVSG
ncbi:MAG: hypothetical protein ACT4PI_09065 [Actinomycetota bacterium]